LDDKWRKAAEIYRQQNAKDIFGFPAEAEAQVQKLIEFLKGPSWRELLEASQEQILIGGRRRCFLDHEGLQCTAVTLGDRTPYGVFCSAETAVYATYQAGIQDICTYLRLELNRIADKVL